MISLEIFEKFREKLKDTGFSSVDEYVNYLLQASLGKKSEDLSEEDTEVVTARLKALGYI
jgi:hypothetical protein